MVMQQLTLGLLAFQRSPTGKERSASVILLKYAVVLSLLATFLTSLVLLCLGEDILDPYLPAGETEEQVNCFKNTWLVFLILNLVFSLMGLIGFVFERIACAFFFAVYACFVSFGLFFDTVSRNHWFLFLSLPVTLASLVLVIVMRLERLDPPPPVRKYSIYTNASGKA